MDFTQIDYAVDDHVGHVTLNNPGRMNAVGSPMAAELVLALQAAATDDNVRVVVLSGAGKAFCAGGDIGEFEAGLASGDLGMSSLVADLGRATVLMRTMAKPVVVGMKKVAAGAGLGLALAGDVILAGDDARLVTAFAGIGLVSDTGVGYVLTRAVGHVRASELLMRGRALSAPEAKDLGLISDVVPAAELEQATCRCAGELAAGPVGAFAGIKQQIWQAGFADYEDYLAQEVELQTGRAASAEFREGIAAFVAKRPAVFR